MVKPALLMMALLLVLPLAARAQAPGSDFPPPPLVPASPPPMPALEPTPAPPAAQPGTISPGTPPPPGAVAPGGQTYLPGSRPPSGYAYSPYGAPRGGEKPGPEVGIMVSESLFGMLSAAGVAVLPFLMFYTGVPGMSLLGQVDPTVGSVLLIAMFAAIPMSVSQTIISIANGSRFYVSEGWPAQLSGLLAEAGVLGLYYLTGWMPLTAKGSGGNAALLFAGTIIAVPLVEMAVTNLAKQPRFAAAGLSGDARGTLTAGLPVPTPAFFQSAQGPVLGVNLPLVSMRW